jgi:hypothetical protein
VAKRTRVTIDLDRELFHQIAVLAAQSGQTIPEFCIEALEQRRDAQGKTFLSSVEAPLLAELWANERDAVYDNT